MRRNWSGRGKGYYWVGGHSAQWTSPTPITRSNLNIFPIFLKHWTQLIQSYNYASQSMWGSQRAEINSGGGRWWPAKDRAAKTFDIPDRICRIKPAYFPRIFEALSSSCPTLQLPSYRKFFIRARLGAVRGGWPIDRGGGGPASRRRPSGGPISLGHPPPWPREACRE